MKLVFVMFSLPRWPPTWEMAVHLAAADDVFGSDYFCVVFSNITFVHSLQIQIRFSPKLFYVDGW